MAIETLRLDPPRLRKKICRNPECRKPYVGHFAQVYCHPDCKKADYRRKRDESRTHDLA